MVTALLDTRESLGHRCRSNNSVKFPKKIISLLVDHGPIRLYRKYSDTYDVAPMKERPNASSTYRALAQKQAVVERRLTGEHLRRLADICHRVDDVDARLSFDLDDHARVVVEAEVMARVALECQRCLGSVDRALPIKTRALIAFDESQASVWQDQVGVTEEIIVVADKVLDVAEIIEDEVILALPLKVCVAVPCENAPAMIYDGGLPEARAAEQPPGDLQRPFGDLRRVLDGELNLSKEGGDEE